MELGCKRNSKNGFVQIALLLAVVASASGNSSHPADPHGNGPGPIWQLDLGQYGFNAKLPWSQRLNRTQGAFTTDQVLVLTYFLRQESELHAVFLDGLSGKVVAQRVFQNASGLIPTNNGRFIVKEKGDLVLFGPSLEAVQKIQIDCTDPPLNNWCYDVRRAPSGKVIFVQSGARGYFKLRKLDADSLQVLGSWESGREFFTPFLDGPDSLSDSQIAAPEKSSHSKGVYIRDISRPWPLAEDTTQTIVTDPHWHEIFRVDHGRVFSSTFINQNLIAVCGSVGIIAIKDDGKVQFRNDAAHWPQYLTCEVTPSSNGKRFALAIATQWLNFSEFPSVIRFVGAAIYDIDQGKRVFKIYHKPAWSNSVALSPDGSILALAYGGRVEGYRVPTSPH
jgi:hypothetical protein